MGRRFRKRAARLENTRSGLGEDEVVGFPGDFAISEGLGTDKLRQIMPTLSEF